MSDIFHKTQIRSFGYMKYFRAQTDNFLHSERITKGVTPKTINIDLLTISGFHGNCCQNDYHAVVFLMFTV